MAITSYLYQILISLKKKELISSGKTNSILEIGEQNWYGDVSFQDLMETIDNYVSFRGFVAHKDRSIRLNMDQHAKDVLASAKEGISFEYTRTY